jgi:indole-3-glycerol phosphate synthase
MAHILDAIVATKREEVARLKERGVSRSGRTDEQRPFINSLAHAQGLGIIAEVKKASPSKGLISATFDPVAIATLYQQGGATAISVLTDEQYFMGAIAYLIAVREAVSLPVLRKDFIIDPLQVFQTASINADAMLLIAAILSNSQMQELYCAAHELSLDVLLEVHSIQEAERVLNLSPQPVCIGINNRDLRTFETNIKNTTDIIKYLPSGITVISESGIHTPKQAAHLKDSGVKGLLIGESLMRNANPAVLLQEFINAV